MSNRVVKDESQRPFVMIDAELIKALTPLEFITYAQIKRKAWKNDECWQSIAHMAEETSMSTGSLKRSLKSLLRQNLIAREKQPGKTDVYTLTPPSQWRLSRVDHRDLGGGSQGSTEHRSQRSTNNIPLELDPIKKKEGRAIKNTATDRSSELQWLDSNLASPSLFSEDEQPTAKQPPTNEKGFEHQEVDTPPSLLVDPDSETIDCATQQQGSVSCAEPIKSEEGTPPRRNTRDLVYGDKSGYMKLNRLVATGEKHGWWRNDQVDLAAFQWAIHDFRLGQGYNRPVGAVKKMFEGLEKGDQSAIEEIAGYWARYDRATQTIAPKQSEPMPWVKDGQVIPAYAGWVKSNDRWLDGQLPDGTYKINLILTTTKSNKFARDAWEKYQETLKADEARKRRSEEMANDEVYEPELPPLTDEQKARAEAIWLKVAELKAKRNAKAS
jgi:DNA-binding MarR family transcriptional regulator